jgi:predicted transcriptional regulator
LFLCAIIPFMVVTFERAVYEARAIDQIEGKPNMSEAPDRATLAEMTAEITKAYVANHSVALADIANLIGSVSKTLSTLGVDTEEASKPEPAVPIRRSVHGDYIVCLEDGKKLKLLKRYLATRYNMTPQEYRERWNLPVSYPMVAPNYAKMRSEMALKLGLGTPKKNPTRRKKRAA